MRGFESYQYIRSRQQRGQIAFITGQEEHKEALLPHQHQHQHQRAPSESSGSSPQAGFSRLPPIAQHGSHDLAPSATYSDDTKPEKRRDDAEDSRSNLGGKYLQYSQQSGSKSPSPLLESSHYPPKTINYDVDSMAALLFETRNALSAEQDARRRLEFEMVEMRVNWSKMEDVVKASENRSVSLLLRVNELERMRTSESELMVQNEHIDEKHAIVEQQRTEFALNTLRIRLEQQVQHQAERIASIDQMHAREMKELYEMGSSSRKALEDRIVQMTQMLESRIHSAQQVAATQCASTEDLLQVTGRVIFLEQSNANLLKELEQSREWNRALDNDTTAKQDWVKQFLLEQINSAKRQLEARLATCDDLLKHLPSLQEDILTLGQELSSRLNNLEGECAAEASARDMLESQLQQAIKQVYTSFSSSLRDTLGSVESRLTDITSSYSVQFEKTQQKVDEGGIRMESLVSSLEAALRAEAKVRRKAHALFKSRLENIESKSACLSGIEDEFKNLYVENYQRITALAEDFHSYRTENLQLQDTPHDLTNRVQYCLQQLDALSLSVSTASASVTESMLEHERCIQLKAADLVREYSSYKEELTRKVETCIEAIDVQKFQTTWTAMLNYKMELFEHKFVSTNDLSSKLESIELQLGEQKCSKQTMQQVCQKLQCLEEACLQLKSIIEGRNRTSEGILNNNAEVNAIAVQLKSKVDKNQGQSEMAAKNSRFRKQALDESKVSFHDLDANNDMKKTQTMEQQLHMFRELARTWKSDLEQQVQEIYHIVQHAVKQLPSTIVDEHMDLPLLHQLEVHRCLDDMIGSLCSLEQMDQMQKVEQLVTQVNQNTESINSQTFHLSSLSACVSQLSHCQQARLEASFDRIDKLEDEIDILVKAQRDNPAFAHE